MQLLLEGYSTSIIGLLVIALFVFVLLFILLRRRYRRDISQWRLAHRLSKIAAESDLWLHVPHLAEERGDLDYYLSRLNSRFARRRRMAARTLGKKDTQETSGAAAHSIVPRLTERGAEVFFSDPYVEKFRFNGSAHKSVKLNSELLSDMDAVIVLTDHSNVDYDLVVDNSALILDTRNVLASYDSPAIHH